MKKNIKRIIIKIAALNTLIALVFLVSQYAAASEFNLNALSAGNLQGDEYGLSSDIPMPLSNKAVKAEDDMTPPPAYSPKGEFYDSQAGGGVIGLNLAIRVPYGAIKKVFLQAAEAQTQAKISVMDKEAPIIFKSGESLKINNIRVDIGGIIVEPELTFKPYGISKDVLGIQIQRAKLHISLMPDKSMATPQLTQEDIVEKVMDVFMKTLMDELAKRLSAGNMPLKAEDIVTLQYDKAKWLLRGELHTEFVRNYIPPYLVGDVHFTGFTINDSSIMVNVGTGK